MPHLRHRLLRFESPHYQPFSRIFPRQTI
jgi:hypothetical protein